MCIHLSFHFTNLLLHLFEGWFLLLHQSWIVPVSSLHLIPFKLNSKGRKAMVHTHTQYFFACASGPNQKVEMWELLFCIQPISLLFLLLSYSHPYHFYHFLCYPSAPLPELLPGSLTARYIYQILQLLLKPSNSLWLALTFL
jgi:hypothetical protein